MKFQTESILYESSSENSEKDNCGNSNAQRNTQTLEKSEEEYERESDVSGRQISSSASSEEILEQPQDNVVNKI